MWILICVDDENDVGKNEIERYLIENDNDETPIQDSCAGFHKVVTGYAFEVHPYTKEKECD